MTTPGRPPSRPIRCARGDPLPAPEELVRAGIEAARGAVDYADPLGTIDLRRSASEHLRGQIGVEYCPESEIIATAGASPAVFAALLGLTAPGETVMIPDPGWPAYEPMVTALGRCPIRYPADPFRPLDGVRPDGAPAAIVVNSPHNPTGSVLDRPDLERLEALRAAFPQLAIVSDETYDGLVFDGRSHLSPASLPGLTGATIVVRSFSKTCSMPGWRVGYLAAPGPLAARIAPAHLATNSFPSVPSQRVARWALDHGAAVRERLRARYEANRDLVVQRLRGLPLLTCAPSQGTLYLFPAVALPDRAAADELARGHGVHVYPGETFGPGGRGHMRICLALDEADLEELCRRLRSFAEGRR